MRLQLNNLNYYMSLKFIKFKNVLGNFIIKFNFFYIIFKKKIFNFNKNKYLSYYKL